MSASLNIDFISLAIIGLGLLGGGILKGATGAGMPIIAVPVIAAFYDARLAVVVLVIPNFITNAMQMFRYRMQEVSRRFTLQIALSGMAGAAIGTLFLVSLPTSMLNVLMAGIVFVYVGLRLWHPDFRMSLQRAEQTAWIAGGIGGILQGALGISAPAAVTFLNAVRLPRPSFIFTASAFFAAMCLPQFFLQLGFGLMTMQVAAVGLVAVVPLMVGLSVGEWIGKRMSARVFDCIILGLLIVLAMKLVLGAGVF